MFQESSIIPAAESSTNNRRPSLHHCDVTVMSLWCHCELIVASLWCDNTEQLDEFVFKSKRVSCQSSTCWFMASSHLLRSGVSAAFKCLCKCEACLSFHWFISIWQHSRRPRHRLLQQQSALLFSSTARPVCGLKFKSHINMQKNKEPSVQTSSFFSPEDQIWPFYFTRSHR